MLSVGGTNAVNLGIEAATGEVLWRVETPANLAADAPVVSNRAFYIAGGMGTLYAIGGTSD